MDWQVDHPRINAVDLLRASISVHLHRNITVVVMVHPITGVVPVSAAGIHLPNNNSSNIVLHNHNLPKVIIMMEQYST